MKMAPKDKRFVLWASAPDGSYTKLGQVINTGKRQESEIRSETALTDFGFCDDGRCGCCYAYK